MKKISLHFRDTGTISINVNYPEYCPHCGKNISPERIQVSNSEDSYHNGSARFVVTFRCSRGECKRYFAIEYSTNMNSEARIVDYYYRPPIEVKLPENIEKVSSVFVEIYSQATVAEQERLDQIAGVGYRKAAEFLIKDYVISKNPEDSENIKRILLGKVISDYLSDFPKLQALARSVAWIGNDETHYIRRHNDKDLQDLKRFILAAAQFIAADYDADDALSFTSPD